ncbi:hypothetical protein VTJ04DRAFT_1976 [Mycothermus thermophilus]|uniref:uncharacterized protein n=1 Tax=Humicola insolens TaxID=85995 RepID=UPI003742F1E8
MEINVSAQAYVFTAPSRFGIFPLVLFLCLRLCGHDTRDTTCFSYWGYEEGVMPCNESQQRFLCRLQPNRLPRHSDTAVTAAEVLTRFGWYHLSSSCRAVSTGVSGRMCV